MPELLFQSTVGTHESTRRFSYDAVEQTDRRKAPPSKIKSEDFVLPSKKRDKLISSAHQGFRNFSVIRWAVERHLDYVVNHDFHSNNAERFDDEKYEKLDDQIEQIVREDARPGRNDARGRLTQSAMVRRAERLAFLGGDVGLTKIRGGRLELCEGDKIKNPPDAGDGWTNGVQLDRFGRARRYAKWRRTKSGLEFDRTVRADNFLLHAYIDREDQVRGISPLASGLNTFNDAHEGIQHALMKAKINQYFGVKITRQAEDQIATIYEEGEDDDPETEDVRSRKKYSVDLGAGPIFFDMDEGEDVDFMSDNTAPADFQAFEKLAIMIALKAADIPYGFFDEDHGKFHSHRSAWIHYERACLPKRQRVQELLYQITVWRLQIAVIEGRLELPAGISIADLAFAWVPHGMPWWKPQDEVSGALSAIAGGLDNPQRVCLEANRGDYYSNIRAIARAKKYADKKGVELTWNVPPQPKIEVATDA